MIEFACKTLIVVTCVAFVWELLARIRRLERRDDFFIKVLTTQAEFNLRCLGMPVPGDHQSSEEVT